MHTAHIQARRGTALFAGRYGAPGRAAPVRTYEAERHDAERLTAPRQLATRGALAPTGNGLSSDEPAGIDMDVDADARESRIRLPLLCVGAA